MINLEKAKQGDLVWWSKWEISKSGRKFNLLPPVLLEVREIINPYLRVGKPGENEYITIRFADLYYTEEEAWEEYNKDIYRTIDILTSEYENSVKFLKSKLHT